MKIFSDASLMPSSHPYNDNPVPVVELLRPFWLNTKANKPEHPWQKAFVHYHEQSDQLFEITDSLEQADIAVLPVDYLYAWGYSWHHRPNKKLHQVAQSFYQSAKEKNKRAVVFFTGETSHETVPIQDVVLFRQSLLASERGALDFCFPPFVEDFVELYLDNKMSVRQKGNKPVVSFDGYAYQSSSKLLTRLFHQGVKMLSPKTKISRAEGYAQRSELMKHLSASSLVETHFTVRDGARFYFPEPPEIKLKRRLEYVQSLINSDYILCCKGIGNYSYRLFETLCCGRIPVIVDTDVVLPYDFKIDWQKYCVWIKDSKSDKRTIAEQIANFHDKLSPEEFIDLQHECRNIWKTWLSAEGFFSNFHLHFKTLT